MPLTRALVCDCGSAREQTDDGEYLVCRHCDNACPATEAHCPKCRGYNVNSSRRLVR